MSEVSFCVKYKGQFIGFKLEGDDLDCTGAIIDRTLNAIDAAEERDNS